MKAREAAKSQCWACDTVLSAQGASRQDTADAQQENTIYEIQLQADDAALPDAP